MSITIIVLALFSNLLLYSNETKKISCIFPNQSNLMSIEDCAIREKDMRIKIKKVALKKIKFDKNGLAGGHISENGCYWLAQSGQLRKTYCYDNGADVFSEGLSRYINPQGKFGFMDHKLSIKIPATYTFAFPFNYSGAVVCIGCKTVSVNDSEHSILEGGKWMIINQEGKVIKHCKGATKHSECFASFN